MNKKNSTSSDIPNKESLEAIKNVEEISTGKKKAKKYSDVAELRKDLKV